MFKQCWNLPAGHCVAGVQAVKAMLEPTCRVLWFRGAGSLIWAGTYLPGTVGQRCRLFNTFTAKHDCSRIYCSLPNATTVEI